MNWETAAINFIKQASRWDKEQDIEGFLPVCMSTLKRYTGAYLTLQIDFEDAYTAKVKNATPTFLNDVVLNPEPIKQLLEDNENKPIFRKDISMFPGVFDDIFLALSSAAIIPVDVKDTNSLLVFGWSNPQDFPPSFLDFMELVQLRMKEILWQSAMQKSLSKSSARFTAIMHAIPDAVIFIDEMGVSGWINRKAAKLLNMPEGNHQSNVLAEAMAKLRNTTSNTDEINADTAKLFATAGGVISKQQWNIQQPAAKTLLVSSIPVQEDNVTGRIWIFAEN